VETAIAQPLDYASPQINRGGRGGFRAALTLFAAGGILANLGFIGLVTQQLHHAQWVYHDLMQNPRAYGREIDPVTIASLRDVRPFWTSFGAFGVASTFGLMLAVNLLVAASMIDRNAPAAGRRLTKYRRWKPLGIALTTVTSIWAGHVNYHFWVTATRHIPLGSGGPPIVSTTILVVCAVLPWWWIGKRFSGETAAR